MTQQSYAFLSNNLFSTYSGNGSYAGINSIGVGNSSVNTSINATSIFSNTVIVGNTTSNLIINSTSISISNISTNNITTNNVSTNNILISNVITMSDGSQISSLFSLGPRNRLINSAMDLDQRNNGASGTATNVYTVDRWVFGASQTGKMTWGQNLNAVTPPTGFSHYFGIQTTTAYTVTASDYFEIYQPIEAGNIPDFMWGTSSAKNVVLSFKVYSSLTGNFGGSIQNYAGTRSYPFSYNIPTANTWTNIFVVIPGDTGGTWVLSGTAGSLNVSFSLGCGSTYSGTANTWATGTNALVQPNGSVSVVGTSSATFYLTGVQLELGSIIPTPFERKLIGTELALSQRYAYFCNKTFNITSLQSASYGISILIPVMFPVTMRATPSMSLGIAAEVNCSGYGAVDISVYGFDLYITMQTGSSYAYATWGSAYAVAEL